MRKSSLLIVALLCTLNLCAQNTCDQADKQHNSSDLQVKVIDKEYQHHDSLPSEIMPKFPYGDLRDFSNFIREKIVYPKLLVIQRRGGRVVAQFIVDKSGRINNIEILQSTHPLLTEAAVIALSKSPLWTPGRKWNEQTKQYECVDVLYTLPFVFSAPK